MIRARTLDELIDVATLLSAQPVPRGRRVALVTNAGGLGILAADACEAAGLELPPPSDDDPGRAGRRSCRQRGERGEPDRHAGRRERPRASPHALPPVLADPAFDAAIVLFVPTVGTDEEEVGAAISRAAATVVDKPVLCTFVSAKGAPSGLRSAANVPSFAYPEAAATRARRARSSAVSGCGSRPGAMPELECDRDEAQAVVREAVAAGGGWLDAEADAPPARGLRRAARAGAGRGHRSWPPWRRPASSVSPSCSRPRRPVRTRPSKAASPSISATRKPSSLPRSGSGAPFLVQPFVSGGAELLAGAVQDPVFGPLVAFGPGGVLAELIGEAQFRLAPLTDRRRAASSSARARPVG